MKAGWEIKPLGEVCRLINGRAYKQAELLEAGPYPVLRVGNFFTNNHWYHSDLELDADKYCDNGDLLYAWSASFGPRIWQGGKVIYHYHIWKVAPDLAKLKRDYLYYFFDWDKKLIKKEQGAGTTMIHVSKGSMEARHIPLPPLEEQQRIVAVLDEAFEGLTRARTHAQTNLQNARELFETTMKYLCQPQLRSWSKMLVADTLLKIKVSRKIQRKNYLEEGAYPIISQEADFINGYWNDGRDLVKTSGPIIVFGDHTRSLKFVDFDFVVGADGTQLMAPIAAIDPRFYFFALRTIHLEGKGYARHYSHLKKSEISFPKDLFDQRKIANELEELEESVNQLQSQYRAKLADIDALRQSLLQKAFAGELT